ncbi:MAG: divalent-cation tolerance protein CutA [Candidatus Omnitrophica bacterium]|nr:divalent-cation tolerance protein CutA [Candidatus Omnitrophota bacterium]
MDKIIIFVTCANKKEADRIAKALLKEKLVACVNILDKVESFFWWEAKIDHAQETLLIIKSKKTKLAQIIKLIKSMHSYKVPEIIALKIAGGDKDYLRWIDESVR